MDNSIFENTQFPYNIATESSNEPLKILQINLARAKAATNQLQETASMIKPDVILVQEQYLNINGIPGIPQTWKTFSSSNQKAAILIPSPKLKPALLATKVNMAEKNNPDVIFSHNNDFSLLLTSTRRSYNSPGNSGDHLQLTRGKDHNWR
ncbi:hypothetical protein AVEN_119735-1 [Araneus ventricosus]|uniref:Endonuclease/exonuclease/phosphatase domain-containing protein n=1 Tax=Araneus ventricosus TaxID=182803 RepID=A0A4Y2TY09_ARAVE|nr:hypothetical protein AVEN_119735-1 [Araneus ventricosus]